jgi:hypothetical protein
VAKEIQWLNAEGVRTEGSCCGHGNTPAVATIKPSSAQRAKELGYDPEYQNDIGLFSIILRSERTAKCRLKKQREETEKSALIEQMCIAFADSQNKSAGRRILNAWCDMPENIRAEIRAAMREAFNQTMAKMDHKIIDGAGCDFKTPKGIMNC